MGAAKRRHGNEWGGAQVDINTPGACVSSGFSLSCLSNKRAQWRWAGGGSGKPADEAKNGLATLPNDGYTVTVPTSRSERAGGQTRQSGLSLHLPRYLSYPWIAVGCVHVVTSHNPYQVCIQSRLESSTYILTLGRARWYIPT